MGELDLDKIERTYPGLICKKHELDSVRLSAGRAVPRYKQIIRRDLRKTGNGTAGGSATDTL